MAFTIQILKKIQPRQFMGNFHLYLLEVKIWFSLFSKCHKFLFISYDIVLGESATFKWLIVQLEDVKLVQILIQKQIKTVTFPGVSCVAMCRFLRLPPDSPSD